MASLINLLGGVSQRGGCQNVCLCWRHPACPPPPAFSHITPRWQTSHHQTLWAKIPQSTWKKNVLRESAWVSTTFLCLQSVFYQCCMIRVQLFCSSFNPLLTIWVCLCATSSPTVTFQKVSVCVYGWCHHIYKVLYSQAIMTVFTWGTFLGDRGSGGWEAHL